MQNRKLLFTAALLVAFGLVAASVSMTYGSRNASAGASTPTATPCPTDTGPDPVHGGCIPITPTATATPCPTDQVPGPTPGQCVLGTAYPFATVPPTATPCPYPLEPDPNGPGCRKVTQTPTPSRTPCPTGKVPNTFGGFGCGTPTATPTSIRPYGADLRLLDHYPSPAIAGRAKTWVFEIENVGSSYGCEAHQVFFQATMTGQADSNYFSPGAILGCHETIEVSVASIVTAHAEDTIAIDAYAQAGASSVMGHVTASDTVIPLGDFDCAGSVNAIDAALILQLTAALIQPFDCTGAGDVNHDGSTNAIDASLILQYTAGLITSFA